MWKYIFILITIHVSVLSFSQDFAYVHGKVTDQQGKPVANVNIFTADTAYGASTNNAGNYRFKIPAKKNITIIFSHIDYFLVSKKINAEKGENIDVDIQLQVMFTNLSVVEIEDYADRIDNLVRIDPKTIEKIPNLSGGIETIIKTVGLGVTSTSELSSQYSVRGGNFDENLVYVNGIEVYRPFLTRSGQQEGLSFVNPEMVSSIQFSSGGFETKYGDKMSSVLDIKYKRPNKFGGSVSGSFLGGSAHIEGCSDDYRFTYISGIRYKSNRYILGSLDTDGEYSPVFTDFQTYLTYDLTDLLEISFLGNYAQNIYNYVPVDRRTDFGTVQNALNLMIYFDGQEVTKFNTYFGALSMDYHPNKKVSHKFTVSGYHALEAETFDIQGQYYLNELDKEIGSDNLGDSLMNIGVGTYLEHARNYLDVTVLNCAYNGNLSKSRHELVWGVKAQHEIVIDDINEWIMRDSAGFSLPFPDTPGYAPDHVALFETILSNNTVESNRATAFFQDTYTMNFDSSKMSITAGIRAHYWDFSNQTVISPRASIAYKPNWKKDFLFKLSGGFYYQPPFYKEIRNLNGQINRDIKAQQSIHLILGSDFNFRLWDRPFKHVTEIYYKHLNNLIPYQVDYVRIRYYGDNNAKGYAVGIDMKINGEFVKGVDSWASISVMQTKEDILDDFYYEYFNADGDEINPVYDNDSVASTVLVKPGYIPRPTDQTVNFGLFFQDYLPRNPSYKVQLSLFFGSRLKFGPPNSERYTHTLKIPPYRRVDIGFSKVLKSEEKILPDGNPFRHFKSIWLTAEVFNLLGIKNTISYIWIDDIYGRQYAVPNYLSNRRLNIKLIAKF